MGRIRSIGIDWDCHGAVASIDIVDGEPKTPTVYDMPIFEVKVGKSVRPVHDISGIAGLLSALKEGCDEVYAYLETAQALPASMGGGIANFARGRASGILEGALSGAGIPYGLVQPRLWKHKIGLKVGATKDDDRMEALRRFPACAGVLNRKKDHGRADAILIAYYGTMEKR